MKTIFLLRHAKSSWDNLNLDDFDRPLSNKGIKASKKIGNYLKTNKFVPDIIYCSTAKRAKQTWELTNRIIKKKKNILYKDNLYMANLSEFMKIIKKTKNKFKNLMIVSHNPGIESLAIELSKNENNKFHQIINIKYPTGALVVIKFNLNDWGKINYKKGEIYEFIKPKEL
ncbi:MAG: phosphohistidine phosphatase [Pelagibacteraceae bacterium]|nr:phosphohistidine phosphatase [Pelagibacteraceae bacterium]PPR33016.1 MAG: 2,3-bisphosphoglycerate-dependent phosphoglycerate mutase [Alphaproteobacteria bacterium MarineAlpha6_Bin5]|tara:strand:- start:26 stop:538 length:513 start_codon:yes stop_codon:yes gene_type:complete